MKGLIYQQVLASDLTHSLKGPSLKPECAASALSSQRLGSGEMFAKVGNVVACRRLEHL